MNAPRMQVVQYYPELFERECVPTEATVYHLLTQTPLAASVTYLAVPWTFLINGNLLPRRLPAPTGPGFTVCQHYEYEHILPILRRSAIKVLFTPHVYRDYAGLEVLPFPHFAMHGSAPAARKDIFYSFIGLDSTAEGWQRLRKRIFEMRHPAETVIIERKMWHWLREAWGGALSVEDQRREKEEYRDVLARSRFSLCPRGAGVSTIRFWESLQAGAIPVLLADRMRLPAGIDWDSTIVRVPEARCERLAEILSQISPEREAAMREGCLRAYERFSGANLVSSIRGFYER